MPATSPPPSSLLGSSPHGGRRAFVLGTVLVPSVPGVRRRRRPVEGEELRQPPSIISIPPNISNIHSPQHIQPFREQLGIDACIS